MAHDNTTRTHGASNRLRGPALAVAITGLLLGGCAGGEDFTYNPISEIPEGQGLVTGPEGEFTLFKYDPSQSADAASNTTAPVSAPSRTVTSSSGITEAQTPE